MPVTPGGLVGGGDTAQHGFQLLIRPLHLTVSLGMEARRQTHLGPQFRTQLERERET